ncbi:hypothetical protein E4N71_11205 [Treponema vincentii]|uniref:hypothetical protein n=1 Tax=Treponema vincentii TaxID=69710 RepID=UPI003D8C86E7
MIVAISANGKIVITINDSCYAGFRLERRANDEDTYSVYTASGFHIPGSGIIPVSVNGDILDNFNIEANKLYSYRAVNFDAVNPQDKDYEYSNWVRSSGDKAIGYTFSNYKAASGAWGTAVTPDDLRFTYLWGTDFKATNGQSYTDEQIQYFIDSSTAEIERQLDITIKKQKIRCNAVERNLVKDIDYDTDESVYDFKYARISRYGVIKTRQRPILKLHKLELLSRWQSCRDITQTTIVDKTKGLLKLMERPLRPSETSSGIQTAIGMYGNQTLQSQLFYLIDYDAGFETSDDIPQDLREIIAKQAAVSLLNIIGDGLMSGFSSSSLSMDGLSESFSSTQSATSAYFGARIKEYKDDISNYIKQNKYKFANMPIGSL